MGQRISLAIPVYNEEQVMPELLERTRAVLDGTPGGPHEIVLVDDGTLLGFAAILLAGDERLEQLDPRDSDGRREE